MHPGLTPCAGQTPRANIVDTPEYKLDVQIKDINEHRMLTFRRYTVEFGWSEYQLFLKPNDVDLLIKALQC